MSGRTTGVRPAGTNRTGEAGRALAAGEVIS